MAYEIIVGASSASVSACGIGEMFRPGNAAGTHFEEIEQTLWCFVFEMCIVDCAGLKRSCSLVHVVFGGWGMKIVLVVEDDPLVRITVCHYVHKCGWHAIAATSGNAALEILEAQDEPIDAVVTDLRLPDMSGADLPLMSRAPCPFIFMTGGGQSFGNVHGAVLRKPFQAEAFRVALEHSWDEARQLCGQQLRKRSGVSTNLT
jgi:CheY-like chemotaxis protein